MSFAGLLGAGLLGGVANAAKGVGDKIREEAKQKRAMALVDQAQVNAVALQTQADVAARDRLVEQGLIDVKKIEATGDETRTTAETEGAIDLTILAAQGDIDAAAAVVTQANTLTNLDKQGDIAKDLAKLQSELNKGEDANKATLDTLRVNLEGSIAAKAASQLATVNADAASQLATVNADAAAQQASVAADVASTLAGTNADAQAAAAAFAAGTAEVKQGYDMEKLSQTGKQQLLLLNREYELKVQAAIDSKVGTIETFYDETTGMNQKWEKTASGWEKRGGTEAPDASTSKGLTLQVAYNDKGEEIKGYMNGTEFVQVGAAKAAKADTTAEARTYFTKQAKFILGGSPNVFIKAKLTDDDAALMSEWISEAEAAFAANPKGSLSQIVKNIMFKPWVLDELDITDEDISAGEQEANTAANTAGATVLEPMEYARRVATRRQPDFVNAQTAYNNIKAKNGNTDALFKRMKKMGYNPDFLIK